MLPSTCVVVPTYWTRAGGQSRPGDAAYDHPTPVDEEGTLDALLNSLAALDTGAFYLLILVGVVADDVAVVAERRVAEQLARYPSIISLSFGPSLFGTFSQWLAERALTAEQEYFALRHYARIRNLQLAVPHILGTPRVVALDDDEIVTDPAFLTKAVEPLGSEIDGRRVLGLSGYYQQSDGGILLRVGPGRAVAENIFDRKASIMNQAVDRLEALPGDIVLTPFCFGGNMEFSAGMMAQVGFDPGITRGEDIDYLINARMEGLDFFLRKDLRILHCPPEGGSYRDVNLSKTEQDVVRFTYEREKLLASQTVPDLQPVAAQDLMPYPGLFLAEDISDQAVQALEAAGAGEARAFVAQAQEESRQRALGYLDFRQRWPAVMDALHDAATLRDAISARVHGI